MGILLYKSTKLNGYDKVSHTIGSKAFVEGQYKAIRSNQL